MNAIFTNVAVTIGVLILLPVGFYCGRSVERADAAMRSDERQERFNDTIAHYDQIVAEHRRVIDSLIHEVNQHNSVIDEFVEAAR